MRIQKIIIGNYRSLHNEELRCTPLNIIFGPNNVGKSNILKALKLFFNPIERTSKDDLNKSTKSKFIKIAVKMTLPSIKETSPTYQYVHNDNGKNFLFLERRHKADQKAKYFDRYTRKEVFPKNLKLMATFFKDKFLFFDRNIENNLNFLELEKILGRTISSKISENMIKRASELILPRYKQFDKYINSKSQHILENFREVFNLPKQAVGFTCAPNREKLLSEISLELDQEDVVNNLKSKGQGIKNIALFIFRGLLHRFSNKIVAIEELENNLHPSSIRNLINYINSTLKEGKKQFFITTHNLQLLNSVNPKDMCKILMENGKTKIILLIQGNMTKFEVKCEFTDDFVKNCSVFLFEGIYYLSPPKIYGSPAPGSEQYSEKEFVVPIKDAFGYH